MGVIGESVVVLRPSTLGFGTAARKGIDSELAGQDVLGGISASAAKNSALVESDFAATGTRIGDSLEKGTTKISSLFEHVGSSAASLGLPFSAALTRVGQRIDETDTKGQRFLQTLSTIGATSLAVGAVGLAAVAGESVHLATGLQASDALIAAHEDISTKAAANVGKAFTNSAFTTIYSANEMAASFAPVSGELRQLSGHVLTAAQSLDFMRKTGDLAEATNTDLGTTTSTVAKIMQAFQVPLKGTTTLTNELFNASRVTGVNVNALGNVVDRLKARLGVAAPSVADLSSLLVDLNEHGVQGSRGLLVVNSAVTTLLQSIPKVTIAAAKQANTLSNQLANSANDTANASTKLAAAQTSASESVTKANENLVEVQDKIAASNTASAPTTAQQISLQNAQVAVTTAQTAAAQKVQNAQETLNTAQLRASQITKTNALSTDNQVAAMQKLGLQVYDSSGKFVGMRDVIAQLQPKLAAMTQEQQLWTLSQVFGSSASKALLQTVLAGPAAYDKAHKAVTDSTTAQNAAEVQSKTLHRELELLKSGIEDEGDKLGIFLIPKLQDLAKWTAEDVTWMEKHKTVAEALGVVLGGAVAVSVAALSINLGVKLVGSVVKAGESVGSFTTTVLDKLGIVNKTVQETTDTEITSSQEFQSAADQISEAIDLASRNIVYALGQVDATLEDFVTRVQTTAGEVDASFTSINTSAEGTATTISTSMDGLVTSTTDSGLAIIESNAKVAASYEEVGAAAVAGAGEAEGAQAGLAAKSAAGAGAAGAGAAGAEGAAAGVGGIGGVLTAATAGFVAFTATTALLKSNTLGLGSAVTGVASHIANFFGVGPAQQAFTGKNLTSADVPYLQEIVAGQIKHAPLTKAEAAEALRTLHASNSQATTNTKESTTLTSKIGVVAQLQQQLYLATVAHGANSAQAKAAAQSLYATESKYLPGLSKDESTKAVQQTIFLNTLAIGQLKGQQSKLASEGTVADTKKNIAGLKSQLQEQQRAGASEVTLKDTKAALARQEQHLQQLNSVASKISRDQTTITKADQTRASIDRVNQQMAQLRQEIATSPPPKIQSTMKGKLQVTAK